MGSGWGLGRQRPPDRCKRRMNSPIVDCLEPRPEFFSRLRPRRPQPALACLVGLGRRPRYLFGSTVVRDPAYRV